MKRSRFSDERIIAVLMENEAGARVDELCRRHGISTATFHAWRKKFGGMEASDAKRPRELEAEDAKLKRIVAEQVLDMSAMKELLGFVARIGGVGRLSLIGIPGHAMRTYSGRPRSSIRFSTWAAIATSVA